MPEDGGRRHHEGRKTAGLPGAHGEGSGGAEGAGGERGAGRGGEESPQTRRVQLREAGAARATEEGSLRLAAPRPRAALNRAVRMSRAAGEEGDDGLKLQGTFVCR